MGPRPELAVIDKSMEPQLQQLARQRRKHIFVACMPKTASTFLTSVLARLTGFPVAPLIMSLDNEQDVFAPAMGAFNGKHTLTFQHLRATPSNLYCLHHAGIEPIITVRDFADVVVSLRDMIELEQDREYFNALWPHPKQFLKMDRERQIDALIDIQMPWFYSFYVSWHDACRYNGFPATWLTYEQFSRDKPAAVGAILSRYGIRRSRAQIEQACTEARSNRNRLNKGVSGRGREQLTDRQIDRLGRMADYYPWVDFSLVGIDRECEDLDAPAEPFGMLIGPESMRRSA
jgi:hypothetical protein